MITPYCSTHPSYKWLALHQTTTEIRLVAFQPQAAWRLKMKKRLSLLLGDWCIWMPTFSTYHTEARLWKGYGKGFELAALNLLQSDAPNSKSYRMRAHRQGSTHLAQPQSLGNDVRIHVTWVWWHVTGLLSQNHRSMPQLPDRIVNSCQSRHPTSLPIRRRSRPWPIMRIPYQCCTTQGSFTFRPRFLTAVLNIAFEITDISLQTRENDGDCEKFTLPRLPVIK